MARCAWCHAEADERTRLNGVPFHWLCLRRRMDMLRDEKATAATRRKAAARAIRYLRLAR